MNGLFYDRKRCCPDCGARGCLSFHEVPESTREYKDHGETIIESLGTCRDYWCSNCDCEFTLTTWGNAA